MWSIFSHPSIHYNAECVSILLFIYKLYTHVQHQSDKTVMVIDVNAEQEADAKEALEHPTTNCLCLTNIEFASHSLLQLVEHREEPLQEDGKMFRYIMQCTMCLSKN